MDLHMELITFLKELRAEATDGAFKASLDEKIETAINNFFNFLETENILPKIRESFPIKNKLESDNVKKCDSDPLKIRKDNAENFEQKLNKINLKIEFKIDVLPKKSESFRNKLGLDNAKKCESHPSKNETDHVKKFDQKINSQNLNTIILRNEGNLKNIKKFKTNFILAFVPDFVARNGSHSQRPFNFEKVRFDKKMSRISKILSSNLGGRGFRFNMTQESRISRFKMKINKTGRFNLKKPILLGWGVVGNGGTQEKESTPKSTTIWSGGAVTEYRISKETKLVFSRLPNYCRATNQIGFVAHSYFPV